MTTLLIIIASVFVAYIASIIAINKGIPPSISESFYVLNNKKKGLGYLFTIWCFFIGVSVMAVIFEVTDGRWFQFLGLFCGGGLGFVGAAPLFKGREKTIHFVGATTCAVSALLIMVLLGWWFVPVIALSVAFAIYTGNGNLTFWGEIALFVGMFITLFLMV